MMRITFSRALILLATGLQLVFSAMASAADPTGITFYPRADSYPFSSAVQVGDVLYLSGSIGVTEKGDAVVAGGIKAETERMMELIGQTLAKHDLTYADLFKCTVMLADMQEWPAFNKIYAGYFTPGRYPARSAMGVNGLALSARVEMECWAYSPQ